MAEGKASFLFYANWGDTFDELSNEDAGKLIKHLCDYTRDKDPQTDSILIKAVFANMKSTLKRDLDKWTKKSEKNRESANKRWDKNNANASERKERNAKHADSDTDTVNDTDTDILLEKETKEFDTFWNSYDKKKGKKEKVKKKYLGLSIKTRELIMDYIPKYKLSEPRKQYRLNPMTFLNNDGWLDEIITEQDPSKPTNVLPTSFRNDS